MKIVRLNILLFFTALVSVTLGSISVTISYDNGYKTYATQKEWIGVGNIIPIASNVYFNTTTGSGDYSSCVSARQDLDHTKDRLDERDVTQYNPYYQYDLRTDSLNKLFHTNVSFGNLTLFSHFKELSNCYHLANMFVQGKIDRDITPDFCNGTCDGFYDCQVKYIEEKNNFDSFMKHSITRSASERLHRSERDICEDACGRIIQVTDFSGSVGDSLSLNTFMNGTNQYVFGTDLPMTVEIKDLKVSYPLIDGDTYGTDLTVTTNCICHCPYGVSSCNSYYDGCGGTQVCSNNYMGGHNDWSCPLNIGYDSSVCCTTKVVPGKKYKAYKIGTPQSVSAKLEVCNIWLDSQINTTDCSLGDCWAAKCFLIDATFGSTNQLETINSESSTFYTWSCSGTRLALGVEMLAIGELFGYKGGDLILDLHLEGKPSKLATGWNDRYSSEVSKPGWLQFNGETMEYNKNSLHNNVYVELKNCRKDEFRINSNIDLTQTDSLPSTHDMLQSWGDHNIDWTNKLLTINPRSMTSAVFRLTTNFLGTVNFHTGRLGSFNCSRIEPITSVVLSCHLTNYTGGSICFSLKGVDGSQMGVSCGSPTEDNDGDKLLILSYSIGLLTSKGYLCAQGYDNIACSRVNITTEKFNQYNHSWVGTYNETFKNSDVEPDNVFDFGDTSTWFKDFSSGIYPTLVFVAGAIIIILLLVAILIVLFNITRIIGWIGRSRKRRSALRVLKELDQEKDENDSSYELLERSKNKWDTGLNEIDTINQTLEGPNSSSYTAYPDSSGNFTGRLVL